MPKRPRSHELEDESRREFQNLLPNRWVCRDITPDYGLDCHVELFDGNGLATTLMFFVQLKASDKLDLGKALAITLKVDTYHYYRNLDLPVMIGCLHAPTKRFFWRWFHEFKERPTDQKAKTVTLNLPQSAVWNDDSPAVVEADLKSFRQLQAASLPHPIPFSLVFQEGHFQGIPTSLVESAIREVANADLGLLHLSSKVPTGAHPDIAVSNERIVVSWGGLCSLTIKSLEEYKGQTEKLAHDVLTAVAFVLSKAGHPNEAASIAFNHLRSGKMKQNADIFFELLGAMVKARRFTETLSMTRNVLSELGEPGFAQLLLLPALMNQSSFTASELEVLREVMLLLIKRATELGDMKMAATAHYNLGNHLRSQGPMFRKAAFVQYRLAAKSDPGYRERPYFWRELAGLLFHLDRFTWSAAGYQKAIALGGESSCLALCADALMFSGRYREALDLFCRFLEAEPKADGEWHLKKFMLEHLIKVLNKDRQRRNPEAANKLADVIGLSPDEAKAQLDEAIRQDALCSFAWFNFGANCGRRLEHSDACSAYLCAALCFPGDVEAWARALLHLIASNNRPERILWIAQVAYHYNRGTFIEQLYKTATESKEQNLSFPVSELVNLVGELARDRDRADESFELRMVGEGKHYKVLSSPRVQTGVGEAKPPITES